MSFFVFIIVSSSSSVRAQNEKRIVRSIIITNSDTIFNGQKLSDAKAEDRIRLRKELKEMSQEMDGSSENNIINKKKNSKEPLVLKWNDDAENELELNNKDVEVFKFDKNNIDIDSLLNRFDFKLGGLDSNLREKIITMHRNIRPSQPRSEFRFNPNQPLLKNAMPSLEGRKNSSSFNYNYIDQDGIPSRMNIRISEPEKEYLEKITGFKDSNTDLKIEDLTLFPNFSTGKTGVSFNTLSNSPLKLKILNSEFKQVFSDEINSVNGSYNKQISLPKNGVYYIAIKQRNAWFLRKIIKS